MTTATDSFQRSNGALGANWTDWSWSGAAGCTLTSDAVTGTFVSGSHVSAGDFYSASSFANDQYSEITVSAPSTATDYTGVTIRQSGNGGNGYMGIWTNGNYYIFAENGTPSPPQIAAVAGTLAAGDVLKLEATGAALTLLVNGIQVLSATDSTYTAGSPGITLFGNSMIVSSWTGGDGQSSAPDPSVTLTGTSSGVSTYSVSSPENNTGNAGAQSMRVLPPANPSANYPHSFMWLLPVEPGQGTTFGDTIAIVQALGLHDQYNLTCIQVGFPLDPWYADNPNDASTKQETFMLKMATWASANLSSSGTEKHYLLGFSKSGVGGQSLFLKHPDVYAKVASWDLPADAATYDAFDGAPVYGTQANFAANYQLSSANLTTWKAASDIATTNRIWIGGYKLYQQDVSDYEALLTSLGIQFTGMWNQLAPAHAWASDWVSSAVSSIIPVPAVPNGNTVSLECDVPPASIVTLRTAVEVFDHASHEVIPMGYAYAKGAAGDDGKVTLTVLASDVASVSPTGFAYNLTIASLGCAAVTKTVQVKLANGATQHLDQLLDNA